mmetsp:Transcript_14797/g.32259  ORF Transcript_14797/g.32259 Transcript_14797/m.32259 type:complete len:205 (-) Transcript_14797:1245-1859(-)
MCPSSPKVSSNAFKLASSSGKVANMVPKLICLKEARRAPGGFAPVLLLLLPDSLDKSKLPSESILPIDCNEPERLRSPASIKFRCDGTRNTISLKTRSSMELIVLTIWGRGSFAPLLSGTSASSSLLSRSSAIFSGSSTFFLLNLLSVCIGEGSTPVCKFFKIFASMAEKKSLWRFSFSSIASFSSAEANSMGFRHCVSLVTLW